MVLHHFYRPNIPLKLQIITKFKKFAFQKYILLHDLG